MKNRWIILRQFIRYLIVLFLLLVFCSCQTGELEHLGASCRLSSDTVPDVRFRSQPVPEAVAAGIRDMASPGAYLAVYWLETRFGELDRKVSLQEALQLQRKWEKTDEWDGYLSACQSIWDDLTYFPVAGSGGNCSVSFEDSWMYERTYKGERGHEGTDIMPDENERGVFPVVSMTDGVVENIGWLELGGYRVGIRAPHGAYFYYAHLDSYADITKGCEIKAGDLLGFMGDTGYGTEEGTRGKFPVHLHVGIYIDYDDSEISVNPYPALKYLESKRLDFKTG